MTVFTTIPALIVVLKYNSCKESLKNRPFLRVDMEVIISQVVLSYRLIWNFLDITGNHYEEFSQQPPAILRID